MGKNCCSGAYRGQNQKHRIHWNSNAFQRFLTVQDAMRSTTIPFSIELYSVRFIFCRENHKRDTTFLVCWMQFPERIAHDEINFYCSIYSPEHCTFNLESNELFDDLIFVTFIAAISHLLTHGFLPSHCITCAYYRHCTMVQQMQFQRFNWHQ